MSLHSPVGMAQTMQYCFFVVICFILFYTCLPILFPPVLLIIIYRKILSWIVTLRYGKKFTLTSSVETICAATDFHANIYTFPFIVHIEGPCDIQELRRRVQNCLNLVDGNIKPYSILAKRAVQKWGFFWWEDKSDSLDISHHIRYFPTEDNNRIYSETELFKYLSGIHDEMWDMSRPKWEMLVAPQVKLQGDGAICSVLTIRMSHEYMDGLSMNQIVRNVIADQPPPKMSIDPVNPPAQPKQPFYMKILDYIQLFLLGPHFALRHVFLREKHIFLEEGPLTGPKFFGRTKVAVTEDLLKRIRKSYKCTMLALINSAYCGALLKMAKKKNLPVPKEALAGQVYASLPYANEYPQNHFYILYDRFPVGIEDPIERLAEFQKSLKVLAKLQYAVILINLISKLSGILPAELVKASAAVMRSSYGVSNVPAPKAAWRFNNYLVRDMLGMPAAVNGMRHTMGAGLYKGRVVFGFMSEQSKIVSSQEELEELIQEFDAQLKFLDGQV